MDWLAPIDVYCERIEPGVLLSMELRSKTDAPVLTIVGCIVHISEAGPGEWLVGCNFVRELDDEELRKLT